MATVLVLTPHPTLTVTLTLQGEWDVVTHPDEVDAAAQASAIVLLDADDQRPWADQIPSWAARERCIVLTGAADADGWPGPTVQRPFRFDRLMAIVRGVAAGGREEPPPASDVRVDPVAESQVEEEALPEPAPETEPRHASVVVAEELEPAPDPVASAPSGPPVLDDLLRTALDDARRLQDLLARLPAVASGRALAELLAEDVAAALVAPTVGVWQADGDKDALRYRFLGGVGMTPGETMVVVTGTHPVVADALTSRGTGVEHIAADPARVTGLPASRHPSLLVVPHDATPFGDLLVIAGLPGAIPDDAFDLVEAAVEGLSLPMRLCVQLGRLGDQLHGS